MTLEDKLQNLPDQPGVYKMLGDEQKIIYVGKARNLKNRVRQYFHAESSQPPKVRAMMQRVKDIQIIVTDTEVEALILECNLIKEYHPRYNILLRDDKSYPYIKITLQETFPRVMKTRNMRKDGSRYFGPFTDTGAVNETLDLIRRLFPLKSCSRKIDPGSGKIERPCLNYHIRKCLGPCQGNHHHDEYQKMIQQVELLLSGKETELQRQMRMDMQQASEQLDYETAARIRDQLRALQKVTEKQKMDSGREQDQDVIAAAVNEEETYVQVFAVRDGKIVQQHHYLMRTSGEEDVGQILSSFLKQFYDQAPMIPSEILIEYPVEDQQLIEAWLTEKRQRNVIVHVPQRGKKKNLVDLVKKNALIQLEQRKKARQNKDEVIRHVLQQLQEISDADQPPIRIESIDISHTAGVESVGALVVFEQGLPAKKHYRKYRIRSVSGPDDTGSIEELLTRRITGALKEGREISAGTRQVQHIKNAILPDLFLIDGGVGQVSTAERVLRKMQLSIPVMGMIKDDRHRTRWLLFKGQRVDLEAFPKMWHFISAIQEETHRFAISFHQQRRSRQLTNSELTKIPGVGEKRRRMLMQHFRNVEELKRANEQEISAVPGISKELAKNIVAFFANNRLTGKEELE
jgi:excinuclease ABC subunit C